jgi:hypothetical protein
MADRRHPDAERILAHLGAVATQIGPRAWWTRYAFHFTELSNVPSILRHNALYSRSTGERLGIIEAQVGDRRILGQTDEHILDCVRFYWRPRTPMLFQTEGVRAPDHYPYQARCDVPVYICVPMADILARPDVRFTDRTAASPWSKVGFNYEFVEKIPFDLVYHDQAFAAEDRDEIVARRQAEILVPDRFALTDGTRLILRSEAELDTLRDTLTGALADTWNRRMSIATPYPTFFRWWLHVTKVSRNGDVLWIRFNEQAQVGRVGGPVPIKVRFENLETGHSQSFDHEWPASPILRYTGLGTRRWHVTVMVDSVLAYLAAVAA